MFWKIQPYVRKQISIGLCLNIGHILIGYSLGWSAPMIPLLQDPFNTPFPNILTDTQTSLISSSLILGSVLGGPLTNVFTIFGRKPSLILGGVFSIVANITITTAKCFVIQAVLQHGSQIRIDGGFSPNLRGILLTSTGVFHTLGILFAYSVGPFMSYVAMGCIGVFISVLHVVANLSIPESPVFHALKGNVDAVKTTLKKLERSKDLDNVMKLSIDKKQAHSAHWKDLFITKNNRKALWITAALFCFQQGGGLVPVSFFATSILKSAGSSVEPCIATIIIGVTCFSGSLVAPLFIEKFGRKILLMISSAVCCVSMAVLGWHFYLKNIGDPLASRLGWLPLTSLIITTFSFCTGLGILPNTLLGELYSPKVRSIGTSITMTSGMLIGFGTTSFFGYMVIGLGNHGTFWTFSIINALAFLFTVLFVPETKGKTLYEIEQMLKT